MLNETMDFFFALDRVVAVYEQADPLLNMYNMNFLFQTAEDISVEIMGPGFDASDLQRGDLSPHEAYSVSLAGDEAISRMTLVSRIDQASYEESVRVRKGKITKKLDSAPSEELARKIRADLEIPDDLDTYLKKIDSPLCHFRSYQPVSIDLVRDTLKKIIKSGVLARYSEMSGAKFPINFSTSQVNRGSKLVFWDIVSPSLKFQGI